MKEEKFKDWLLIVKEDLKVFIDIEKAVRIQSSKIAHTIELEDKGFISCLIFTDLLGKKICSEELIYLKKEHRNIKNFLFLLKSLESLAKEHNCNYIDLGSSIGYQTNKVKRLYEKFGYKNHNLRKEI